MDKNNNLQSNEMCIIAIDGPAGSGKSTISRLVAKRLGFTYIDTGAMYRAITYLAMKNHVDLESEQALSKLAETALIRFVNDESGKRVIINDEDVTSAIRTPEVTRNVHYIAKLKSIRAHMLILQRKMGFKEKKAVLEGRDIGSVVFPDAQKKIYLDASARERAKRRHKELLEKGIESDFDDVLKDINSRDEKDKTRKAGPLVKADDAVYLDTTDMSIDEVVDKVAAIVQGEVN